MSTLYLLTTPFWRSPYPFVFLHLSPLIRTYVARCYTVFHKQSLAKAMRRQGFIGSDATETNWRIPFDYAGT